MNITVTYRQYKKNVISLNKLLDRLNMIGYYVKPMNKKTFEEMKKK